MLDGERFTRIHGADVPVQATDESLHAMSAHADSTEILRWLARFSAPPRLTCLVHGEPGPMDTLKGRIERELGWQVATPAHQERMDLP
jgi:metallo-beta-lactamase family protein